MLKRMAVVLAIAMASISGAQAAEITVFSPGAVNAAIKVFIPAFTAETGTTVNVIGGTIGGIKDKIAAGAAGDAVILPADDVRTLDKAGRLAPGSTAAVGREEFGVAVRAGAPHPDISTPAAFKAALLAAGSVTYNNPASGSLGGQIIDGLLKRPDYAGIKIVLPAGAGGRAVASGEAEIGIQAMGELQPVKGIDIIGTIPAALNVHMDFAAGVLANAAAPKEALAFIRYITNAQAQAVWKANGLN
jgi:molybdate transport system substrate-binding protein